MCIIPQIHIVQDYGILNYTIVSNKYILKQNGILNHSVYNTAAGDQTVLHHCARVVFGWRKVIDLGLDSRLLLEEIVADLRLQEIHVGLIIGFHSGNIAPVAVDLVAIDSLQILVANENIYY